MKRATSRRAKLSPIYDPIFPAIARHRAAAAAWAATDPDNDPKGDARASKEDSAALEALLCTKPTSAAGCAAVLRYVAGYCDHHHASLFKDFIDVNWEGAAFMPLIADAIEAMAVQS